MPNPNSPLGQGEHNINMFVPYANHPLGHGQLNVSTIMPSAMST